MYKATKRTALAAFSFAAILSGPALADCKPLSRIAALDLVPGADRLSVFVPVTIQGKSKLMLLDTGVASTELTQEAVSELSLYSRRGIQVQYDTAGQRSNTVADASLALGSLRVDQLTLNVASQRNLFSDTTHVVGVLATEILSHYDLDIDFPANKLGIMSPDHCEGKVIYWNAPTVAVAPIQVIDSGHIIFPVTVDGKTVNALLDTGASGTSIAAAEFDYGHTFKSLGFDGIAVNNPRVEIVPAITQDFLGRAPAGSPVAPIHSEARPDVQWSMVLGMNVLRHFHFYIAYQEKKIYITPTEQPAAHATASAP